MKELVKLKPLLKHYKGYVYFRECIRLAQQDELALTAIIKELYIPIAVKHNTSYLCVERDIRTLCKVAWANGGREAASLRGYWTTERVPANKKCIEMVLGVLEEEKVQL